MTPTTLTTQASPRVFLSNLCPNYGTSSYMAISTEAGLSLLENLQVLDLQGNGNSLHVPFLPLLIASAYGWCRPQQGSGETRAMTQSGEG